jgi:hypothetical protein
VAIAAFCLLSRFLALFWLCLHRSCADDDNVSVALRGKVTPCQLGLP